MNHEKEPSGKLPSLDEIEVAYQELNEHNSRHTGLGAAVRRVIQNSFNSSPLEDNEIDGLGEFESDKIDTSSEQADAEADLSLSITAFSWDPLFESIGLARYGAERAVGVSNNTEIGRAHV